MQPAGNEQKPWREALALETWGLPEVKREHFSHFRWERDTSITMPSLIISSRILGRPLAELSDDQQGRHLAKQRHLCGVCCVRAGWCGPYVCHIRFLMAAYMHLWLVLSILFTG